MDASVNRSLSNSRFKIVRAFKALDDGVRRKWVVVAAARDLPVNLPLDANARVPNVTKNPTCVEMRETLLRTPELFQVFNGGMVCTAAAVELKQDGNDHVIEVAFDRDAEQGIVNGGHTYASLINALHDSTQYSAGKTFHDLLANDARKGSPEFAELVSDDDKLAERVARAREKALVQIEFIAPVADSELLAMIARARNLTQGVDPTALQNLAGKFDVMKEILAGEPHPFGPSLVDRIVWKTNQEVPEDSRAVSVKLLIQILALMNTRLYPLDGRTANEVYSRAGVVVREFGEAEGEDEQFYNELTHLLPTLIRFHDHVYASLPEIDPSFPWADGKFNVERKRKRAAASTPILGTPCLSKVVNAFVWPIFSAFRILLDKNEDGELTFRVDPFRLFDDMKTELAMTVQSFHKNQAHGIVHQVGKDKEIWLRLQYQVDRELAVRDRLAATESKGHASQTEKPMSAEEKLLRTIFGEMEKDLRLEKAGSESSVQYNSDEQTRKVLATLTPREEQILRMRFGVGQKTDYTLEEVSKQFAVTPEDIRQIEDKALRKLRQTARSRGLAGFMERE